MKLFWEVLGKEQKKLLPALRFLKKAGFYLSGGTSLALQIKHRTSVDFDFYTPSEFDSTAVYQKFLEQKPESILLNRLAEDTLLLELNNTGVSLFTYPYPLIKSFVISDYLNLASLQDIAAMKMIAIIQRGTKRDFIDLYFLIKKMGLAEILKSSKEKYRGFNEYLALQALTYFGDAEGENKKRKVKFFEDFDWEKAKKFFISEANKIKEKWKRK
ncbi:MAG: nucleotidyl transferase AbiEii/AbiGii toxin family protein [Candidatus Omnitrophota bacterium]